MSIMHAIATCKNRRPLSEGCDRIVYYSPRYKIVIKIDGDGNGEQMDNEEKIFLQMTKEEFDIFPITDIVTYQGRKVILMKKCKPLDTVAGLYHGGCLRTLTQIHNLVSALGLSHAYDEAICNFIKKYKLLDLHYGNLGILNGRLVILDAGY